MLTLANPLFVAYALSACILSLLMLVLWAWSGGVRAGTKTAMNPEDARNGTVVEIDPPAVARVLRAHKNAEAAIVPYLALGLVFICCGGGSKMGTTLFAIFTTARVLHAIVYLAGKQPWRSIMFLIGLVSTLVLLGDIVYLLLR